MSSEVLEHQRTLIKITEDSHIFDVETVLDLDKGEDGLYYFCWDGHYTKVGYKTVEDGLLSIITMFLLKDNPHAGVMDELLEILTSFLAPEIPTQWGVFNKTTMFDLAFYAVKAHDTFGSSWDIEHTVFEENSMFDPIPESVPLKRKIDSRVEFIRKMLIDYQSATEVFNEQ